MEGGGAYFSLLFSFLYLFIPYFGRFKVIFENIFFDICLAYWPDCYLREKHYVYRDIILICNTEKFFDIVDFKYVCIVQW